MTPVPVTTLTYTYTAPVEDAPPRPDAPPIHLAPLAELLRIDLPHTGLDLRLLNKSNRIAGLDMRYQRYKKAEP